MLGERLTDDYSYTEILAPLLHTKVVLQFLITLLPRSGCMWKQDVEKASGTART